MGRAQVWDSRASLVFTVFPFSPVPVLVVAVGPHIQFEDVSVGQRTSLAFGKGTGHQPGSDYCAVGVLG